MTVADPDRLDWAKGDGLLPAVVQHADTGEVLMLAYMNRESLAATQASGRVTFYSRSRQRLWQKGETSGNVLELQSVAADCDGDTLLVSARPAGPVCHLGSATCFGADAPPAGFLAQLERIIAARAGAPAQESYTARLLAAEVRRVAQKVGEEGVETALAAAGGDDGELIDESADLIFHLLVLLHRRGLGLSDVVARLRARHRPAG